MPDRKVLWNLNEKMLRSIIMKPDKFDEAVSLFLQQHAMVHASEMSGTDVITFEDELWEDMDEFAFRTMPSPKDEMTIAWCLWHSSRIEDITMNILVTGGKQIINNDNYIEKMNAEICDTGNAMTNEEIIDFSSKIDMHELRRYRVAVGRKTREIVKNLKQPDMKRKMEKRGLQRILEEGAVLDVEGANWLIDFWGKKDVAGILLMPATRHHLVHINESLKLKEKYKKLEMNNRR